FQEVNQHLCELLGSSSEELLGHHFEEMKHPDDLALSAAMVARALRGECSTYTLEKRYLTKDGATLHVNLAVSLVRDERGQAQYFISAVEDISERKRLEASLWQTAEQMATRAGELEAVFDALVEAVVVYDGVGQVVRMNAATRSLLALEHDPTYEVRPLTERVALIAMRDEHGQPLPEEQWPHRRILRGDTLGGANAPDICVRALDGREARLSVSGAPIRGKDGRTVGAVAIFRDVTERRRLEWRTHEALHALLVMAEALVTDAHTFDTSEPPAAHKATAHEATAHEAAARLADLTRKVLGCQRVSIHSLDPHDGTLHPVAVVGMSQAMERTWWAEWNRGPRLVEVLDPVSIVRLRAGEALTLDMSEPPYNTQPNPYAIVTLLAVPMRLGERLVGILALDHGHVRHVASENERALASAVAKFATLVIEREHLLVEREAARANEVALREANRQMDDFLSMASHELRNPLTGIRASIQLTERRIKRLITQAEAAGSPLAEQIAGLIEPLERGERQTGLLNRLVGDLLDVSRIQTGRLELRPEVTDLAVAVRDIVEQQRLTNRKRRIGLASPADAVQVQADPDRIGQVITNYLNNALKYSAEDRPVDVHLECEADHARVSVRDEGAGIPEDQQARIWERFHRAPDIMVQNGQGTGLGLGLYISRGIIERHGGQVGVESLPGQGSTFWFTLPLAR
ncbi:MAG: PAS domain S-box protein, partial [Ktedonobacterales bacterium]|nr:PAS domain S-box protein [Ktedonobacterales bacterium]